MKKIISWILLICCMIGYCIPTVCAANPSEANEQQEHASLPYQILKEYSVTYSCRYLSKDNMISISGNVSHEIMVSYKNYRIEIYALALGENIETGFDQITSRTPMASTDLAVKFEFSFKAEKIMDRFLQYAVVLRSPTGEAILAANPQMASIEALPFSTDTSRLSWKGVRGGDTSVIGSIGFGTVIVPVYLDRLWCRESAGYMYPMEDGYCYFDAEYIHGLDAQIRTYSANGGRVYLQLLLSVGAEDSISSASHQESVYACPNVYSEETIKRLSTSSGFLASRYSTYQNGMIQGMIIGSSIDLFIMNDCGSRPLAEYAEIYALYLAIIANSARTAQADLDIVIPFSDVNTYASDATVQGGYEPDRLMEALMEILDSRFPQKIPYGTMIESSSTPLLTDGESGLLIPTQGLDTLSVNNISMYAEYLKDIQSRYANAPSHYIYVWNAPREMTLNALACSYVYSFYTTMGIAELSSFVISFDYSDPLDIRAFDIQKILRYIDTERSYEVTENLLPYFGAKDWNEVVKSDNGSDTDIRKVYRAAPVTEAPSFKGDFSYVDFSSEELNGWYCGTLCNKIKLSYGSDGARVLRADMKKPADGAYADLLRLYEFSENWIHTPYVKFTVELDGGFKNRDALYEMVITVGDHQSVLFADCSVRGNEKAEIMLDMSSFVSEGKVNYLKISVRPISGDVVDFSLLLHDIQGFSTVYSSEELHNLIEEERLNIRNQTKEEDTEQKRTSGILVIFAIILVVTAVGTGLFMAFRRYDDPNDDENGDERQTKD